MLFGALLFVLAAETGCTKQDLDSRKNEGSVEILLSWPGDTPKGSKFYFYPQDDVDLSEFTLENPVEGTSEGWRGNLPAGTYRIIVHNSDAENVDMRFKDDYNKAEIYVLPAAEAQAAVRGAGGICHPDKLMLASGIDENGGVLKVPSLEEVEGSKVHVRVTATPTPRIKYLRFFFKIDDAGPVSLSTGTLTGVSPSLHCASAVCAASSERVNFSVHDSSVAGYAYEANVKVLDLVRPGNKSHVLILNMLRPDGSPYSVTIDLSKVVNDILNKNGGAIPVVVPVDIPIELKKIGNDLKAEVIEWSEGTGGGTLE